jgi:uncharacterized membrane protein
MSDLNLDLNLLIEPALLASRADLPAAPKSMRLKTLAMIFSMIVCTNVGDILLKRAMASLGPVQFTAAGLAHAFLLTITQPAVWAGILFLAGCMASYMTVLSWADYSYVMPGGALGLVLLTLTAAVFLGETVSVQRWFGVVMICAGVVLVGQTRPSTTIPFSEISASAGQSSGDQL